jgi:hypothetical protein
MLLRFVEDRAAQPGVDVARSLLAVPTAVVIVRAPPIMSPPAKMPARPMPIWLSTSTTSPRPILMPGSAFRNSTSACSPTASTSESVLSCSYLPVPMLPLPSGNNCISSTVIPSLPNCFTVDIHMTFTPSANASIASEGCAFMCCRSER